MKKKSYLVFSIIFTALCIVILGLMIANACPGTGSGGGTGGGTGGSIGSGGTAGGLSAGGGSVGSGPAAGSGSAAPSGPAGEGNSGGVGIYVDVPVWNPCSPAEWILNGGCK